MNSKSHSRIAVVVAVLLVGSLLSSAPVGAKKRGKKTSSTVTAKLEIPEPQIAPGMASNDRFTFGAAYRYAVKRIYEYESCRALFAGLNLDGIRALRLAQYLSVSTGKDHALCGLGARAVTGVGRAETRLCPGFARLSRNAKASILIHEALHTAGLSEAPHDPAAPDAREITLSVKTACAL